MLEMAIRTHRRGQIFDMDLALLGVLRGERFTREFGGTAQEVTVTGVSNQGFNGQVASCAVTGGGYAQIRVSDIPAAVQRRAARKLV